MGAFFDVVGQVLILIGSLGIFLYGMKLMSSALQKVAGQRMREILSAMTSNRIKGVFTGFLVTTVIQSSSATTVMIISFVNAGLISLIGAIGVIMGANIGTTVTAWIISLLGFKFSIYYVALGLVGLCFPLLFSKKSNRQSWGELVVGFAILFIGLTFLKDAVPDIKSNPEILDFLSSFTGMGFGSVLFFVFIGTVLTLIIQSSSATMALTLVMCYNGWIEFPLAVAMVLGENIGTTITANIAAIVANASAKRAARAHLIFNVIGVIWVLIFYNPILRLVNMLIIGMEDASPYADATIIPIALAMFHTLFNVTNTLLLIGFSPQIAKLATKMVPQKETEDDEYSLKFIDNSYFSTAEISLVQAKNEIATFGLRVAKMLTFLDEMIFVDAGKKNSKKFFKLAKRTEKYEEIADRMEEEIANYLLEISEQELSHQASKRLQAMLSVIDDIESISDVFYTFTRALENKESLGIVFTDEQLEELKRIHQLVGDALVLMNNNLSDWDNADTAGAIKLEETINNCRMEMRVRHAEAIKHKKYKFKPGSFYSELFNLYEKAADYVYNVSIAIQKEND